MNIGIGFEFITGVMVGIEWDSDRKIILFDLGIFRIAFLYDLK